MSKFSQFGGGRATASIVSVQTAAGAALQANLNYGPPSAKVVNSGALTANTLKSLLSITGGGCLRYGAVYKLTTATNTTRIKIVADGVTVVDVTSASSSTQNQGLMPVGWLINGTYGYSAAAEVKFNSSLTVEIASSLTETDSHAFAYLYELE